MVDKGFCIDDMCAKRGLGVVQPPFLRSEEQFSAEDATKTVHIARARVHVERAIQRMKVSKIELEASLDSGRLTDVEFKVHSPVFPDVPERKCHGHKQLLALRHEVFEAMFFGDLAERDVVNITDVHPKGFDIMLRYLYSGSARITNVLDALHARAAARKYLVASLRNGCAEYKHKNLLPSNLFSCLEYYTLTGEPDRDAYVPVVLQSWSQSLALQTLSLKNLAQAEQHVFHFILDNIRHVREIDVATAVMRWSQEQCIKSLGSGCPLELKAVMRPFFAKLHFLTMTAEEFLTGRVTWGIVDNDEAMCVLRNIVSKGALPLSWGFYASTQSRY
ncbi:BTB/POZ domain-containing protein 6-like [Amblyomma americanum]